ncbi:glycosyltransferase family 2 protein [Novosphingobium sp. Leaf2]|uniref:glycosyltransferase family 2 protein n=1 Tax=Novosphingobium sp. Leaf2 TaxID=1735670 RepID=UPI0006F7FC03|nr:glycosyltransferase family 2 protein [Novosphingobium sp. Leaf2]KQM13781.1 succinoglycan biosynthesis protein exoa [Novosphingobium sp. Leaf2]
MPDVEADDLSRNADVLVVIPCLNEEAHLPKVLGGLLRDAFGATIVVADGGSTDDSKRIVATLAKAHANLVWVDNPMQRQSAAVNLAVRRHGAGVRWLVRVDAHADYPANFVDRLRTAADASGATSVVVPMVTQGLTCFQRAAATAQNSVLGTGGAPHRHVTKGAWVDHGHHALFDLAGFMAVGGYDENFAANEDAELDRRLLTAGARIWLEPEAAITYYPRRNPVALFRQYRSYGKGRARNLRRHRAKIKLRQMLPLAVLPVAILAGIGAVLSPFWTKSLVLTLPALAWMFGCVVAGACLGIRQRSLCAGGSGFAAAIMHLAWSMGFVEEVLRRQPLPAPPNVLTFEKAPVCEDPRALSAA